MQNIRCEEIRAGDVVCFLGDPHLIERIEPYTGPHDFIMGVAKAADGWGISLEAGSSLPVGRT